MANVTVEYIVSDSYDIDFDLNSVYRWSIKYGILRVQHEKDGEIIEIEPTFAESDDPCFKFPAAIFQDGDQIVEKKGR